MPYVDLGPEQPQLWYQTNTKSGDLKGFDPKKPLIVFLHPIYFDHSFVSNQFEDVRLKKQYNMLAFDQRSCGRTKNAASPFHDTWVLAADFAALHTALALPPCHIFASQNSSVHAAMRAAMLWPDKVLSLTLCSVSTPRDIDWVQKAYAELIGLWAFSPDLETFEEANHELLHFMFNECTSNDPVTQDKVVAHWQTFFGPHQRVRVWDVGTIVFTRTPETPEELALIQQPVLIIQGDRSVVHPLEHATDLQKGLVNATGGAQLVTIKGGPECMNCLPHFAPQVNNAFVEFLSALPSIAGAPGKSAPIGDAMKAGLARLAQIVKDPSIATRNPRSLLSFSRIAPEVAEMSAAGLEAFRNGEKEAFCPLDKHGRVLRKFSERHHDQWFGSATAGSSGKAGGK